jgi:hypothetical protein
MRRCLWLAIVALGLVSVSPTVSAGDKPKEKQYQFAIKVLEGDPLGSHEDKSQEFLSQPQVVAVENQATNVQIGQIEKVDKDEVFVGLKLQVKPERAKEGTIRLSMVFEYTEVLSEKEDSLLLQTNQARYVRMVKPGELLRLKIGKMGKSTEGQRWVELSVGEVERAK